MPRRSFRTTLTVWNISVLVLVLLASGFALAYGTRLALLNQIDRELAERAQGAFRMRPPPPPFNDGPDFGGPDRPPGPRGGPPPPGDDSQYRRPRRFDAQGQTMEPRPEVPYDEGALREALAGAANYRDVLQSGSTVRVFSLPDLDHGQTVGAVQVARDLGDVSELWQIQARTLLLFVPIAILAGALSALFLTSRALRPIESFTHTAAEITAKDMSQRLEVIGDDELASLGVTFNSMLERLDTAFRDLRAAYENQRRFTADASHELRTPLARLLLVTSGALHPGATPDELRKALQVASSSGREMSELVDQLLVLARADAGHLDLALESVDLRVILAEVVDGFAERRTVTLEVPDHPVMANVAPSYFRRAITNLVQNAVNHTEAADAISVSISGDKGRVDILVIDSGEGIAPEHLPHLGERFYRVDTARTAGSGTGLGLAIVKTIVQAHGGTMGIQSDSGRGTTVTVSLPSLMI